MLLFCFYLGLLFILIFAPLRFVSVYWERIGHLWRPEQQSLALLQISYRLEHQEFGALPVLPRYKDFTTQLELLLALHRRLGIPLKQALAQWKRALIDERKKERQLKRQKGQGLAQALLMLAMTWSFIALSSAILGLRPSSFVLLFCALVPLLGAFFYLSLMRFWERRLFSPLRLFEQSLQRLSLLKHTGLSSEQLLGHLSLEAIEREKSAAVQNLKQQYLSLLGAWRERGVPLKNECEIMLEEISFLLQEASDALLNFEKVIKIIVMMAFFLVPYLVYLMSLISSFLIE